MTLSGVLQDASRTARRHRALLAAGLTAAAVATALPALTPAAPPTLRVVTAAHDLTPGSPLKADDLALVDVPRALVAHGSLTALDAAVGRVVAGPVRSGETLTDVRLLGSGLLQGKGLVAAPVRLADPATVALLHAGDHVDVLAAPTGSGVATPASATTVAAGVEVLAVPTTQDSGADGALVVVAATPATAARLAAAAVGARLSITVLAP